MRSAIICLAAANDVNEGESLANPSRVLASAYMYRIAGGKSTRRPESIAAFSAAGPPLLPVAEFEERSVTAEEIASDERDGSARSENKRSDSEIPSMSWLSIGLPTCQRIESRSIAMRSDFRMAICLSLWMELIPPFFAAIAFISH
jgi:hypothetical protein